MPEESNETAASTAPLPIESTKELSVTQQAHPLKTDRALLLLAPADTATVCIEPAVIAHGSCIRRRFTDPLHFNPLSSCSATSYARLAQKRIVHC